MGFPEPVCISRIKTSIQAKGDNLTRSVLLLSKKPTKITQGTRGGEERAVDLLAMLLSQGCRFCYAIRMNFLGWLIHLPTHLPLTKPYGKVGPGDQKMGAGNQRWICSNLSELNSGLRGNKIKL